MVKRGDLPDASFCFTVEDENWQKREDGTYLRTINKIGDLFDVYLHPVEVYVYGKEIYKYWNSHFDELACCKYIYIVQQKSRP